METKTRPGFQLRLGQWMLLVDAGAAPGKQIAITAVPGSGAPPPAFAPGEDGTLTVINYPSFTLPRAGSVTALLFTAAARHCSAPQLSWLLISATGKRRDKGLDFCALIGYNKCEVITLYGT